MAGQRAGSPPFNIPLIDPYYPSSSTCTSTVGCQAKEVVKFLPYFVRDIYDFVIQFEDYRVSTSAVCSACPNTTTASNVMSMWNNLRISINASISVTSGGSLVAFINGTLGGNLTKAISETNLLIEGYKNCASCLAQSYANNLILNFQPCGRSQSVSSCLNSRQSFIRRQVRIIANRIKFWRAEAARIRKSIFDRLSKNIFYTFGYYNQALSNLRFNATSITNILNINIRISLTNFLQSLTSFNASYYRVIDNITIYSNFVLNATNTALNASLWNATDYINNQTNSFIQLVTNETTQFPCCQQFANVSLAIQANFTQEIESCYAISDNITNSIALNVTLYLSYVGSVFNGLIRDCDTCASASCPSMSCLNGFLPLTTVSKISKCIDGVKAKAIFGSSLYIRGNFTYNGITSNSSTALKIAQNCSDTKVEIVNAAFLQLKADYAACKQTQCGATTTTSKLDFSNYFYLLFLRIFHSSCNNNYYS